LVKKVIGFFVERSSVVGFLYAKKEINKQYMGDGPEQSQESVLSFKNKENFKERGIAFLGSTGNTCQKGTHSRTSSIFLVIVCSQSLIH